MLFDSDKSYNDLPLFPPTKAALRKAIAAKKAPAELKGAGDLSETGDFRHLILMPGKIICPKLRVLWTCFCDVSKP